MVGTLDPRGSAAWLDESQANRMTLPCRYGRLHVNSDWFILEPIDAWYQPVLPGQLSHSLLVRRVQRRRRQALN